MYRIYDAENHCWRNDMIVFDDGALGVLHDSLLHSYNVDVIYDESPYTVHYLTGIIDKNGLEIFEGDICTCPNDTIGVVAFSSQIGAYCIFDDDNHLYYVLDDEGAGFTEVVGNVFDGVLR